MLLKYYLTLVHARKTVKFRDIQDLVSANSRTVILKKRG